MSSGVDCSIVPTCHNVSNCSGNGLCIDFGACHCYKGWTGSNCTEYSCERFDYCSGKVCIYLNGIYLFKIIIDNYNNYCYYHN